VKAPRFTFSWKRNTRADLSPYTRVWPTLAGTKRADVGLWPHSRSRQQNPTLTYRKSDYERTA
jgi:hypothetical protein